MSSVNWSTMDELLVVVFVGVGLIGVYLSKDLLGQRGISKHIRPAHGGHPARMLLVGHYTPDRWTASIAVLHVQQERAEEIDVWGKKGCGVDRYLLATDIQKGKLSLGRGQVKCCDVAVTVVVGSRVCICSHS